jgi:FlaA1/EpsC-like NDP-sugar epimerase
LFSKRNKKRVLIVGAGDAGAMIIKELLRHRTLNSQPVAVIDDDPMKYGKTINGVPVVGNRNEIYSTVKNKRIDEIIIAIPSASKKEISDIVKECNLTDCKMKILPGMFELINGNVNIAEIRNVELEDLLGRDEVKIDALNIQEFLTDKTVLVTGGAGSIGSELIRQIIKYDPRQIVILDIHENGLFALEHELNSLVAKYQYRCRIEIKVASIRDLKRMKKIFEFYRPSVVFHAAAHKHVPLMESNPMEAVKNNVYGTLNLVELADKYHVNKFVLISTDKAVNPTNVMGATKRIAEMIIQNFNNKSNTEYVAVRFGNVLGSNGSVIPHFMKQIENGGPVTVTHPEITRFFMTIPEAAQLVMQAGAIAQGGEIFILDMGDPVKILDLAENLIKLSGYTPYEEIDIEFTGLRPGEKLYEELLLKEEETTKTNHQKIFVGQSYDQPDLDLMENLKLLRESLDQKTEIELRRFLKGLVPTYLPDEKVIRLDDGFRKAE